MVKKSHIATLICLVICCALLVAACIIGFDFNAIGTGKGDGVNAEVTSIEEVGKLINALFSERAYPQNSARAASDNVDDDEKEFTSMTARITSSSYLSTESNNGIFNTSTVQTDILMAITEDGAYFRGEYTVNADAKTSTDADDDDNSKNYLDASADFEMYVSAERLLIRVNKVTAACNGKSSYIYERVIGEWGDFSEDARTGMRLASSFTSTNSSVFYIFDLVSDYINKFAETGFSKKGVSYMMKSDTFGDFAAQLMSNIGSSAEYLDKDYKGSLEFDLENSTKPVITLDFKSGYESDNSESYEKGFTVDVAQTVVLEFSKINNTTINGYDKVDALSAEDYIALMEETE